MLAFFSDKIYCTINSPLSTGNPQEHKTHRQGSTILASLFANFSLEQNLWPYSNKLASCLLSLKRTTATSKGLDFGSIDVFTLRRRPFSSHSRASGLVMYVWVAQFCLVRVPNTIRLQNLFLVFSTEWSRWKIMHDNVPLKFPIINNSSSNWKMIELQ